MLWALIITSLDPFSQAEFASRGLLRGTFFWPICAYFLGRNVKFSNQAFLCFLIGTCLGGFVNSVAIIFPNLFSDAWVWGIQSYELVVSGSGSGVEIVSRASGLFERSTPALVFLMMWLAVSIAGLHGGTKGTRVFGVVGIVLSAVCIPRTIQRAGILGVAFLVIAAFLLNRRARSDKLSTTWFIVLLAVGSAAFVSYPAVFQRFDTESLVVGQGRGMVWSAYVDWFLREPWVVLLGAGVGVSPFSEYGRSFSLQHGHNQLLTMIGFVGLPATVFYLIPVASAIRKAAKRSSKGGWAWDSEKHWDAGLLLTAAGVGAICLVESPLLFPICPIVLFFFAGAASRVRMTGNGTLGPAHARPTLMGDGV